MNEKVVEYVLSNTERTNEGRLIMPLPWNPQSQHLLGTTTASVRKFSCQILKKKFQKDNHLSLYDDVFKEQEEAGVIERIQNVDAFVNAHPESSFLPHMGIFKMKNQTTKVRIVYLSNLCEINTAQPNAVSHNNALLPGPCLYCKLGTSFLLSRFDEFILIFDITKAFLTIQLKECDQTRLLCLWFRSVRQCNFC